MSTTAEIYGLFDPDTDQLRYVGKAKNSAKRLSRHFQEKTLHRPVNRWVLKLVEAGKFPVLRVLETVPYEVWEEAERRWIAHYRQTCDLLNLADGGAIPSQTPAQRKGATKRSNEVQAQSPEAWRNLQIAKRDAGRYLSYLMKVKRYSSAYILRFLLLLKAADKPNLYGCWATL